MCCEIIPHEWTLGKGFYSRAKAAPFEGINANLGQGSRVCSLPETQTHYALLSPFSGCPLRPNTKASVLESPSFNNWWSLSSYKQLVLKRLWSFDFTRGSNLKFVCPLMRNHPPGGLLADLMQTLLLSLKCTFNLPVFLWIFVDPHSL